MTLVGQVVSVQPLLGVTGRANWAYGVYGAVAAAVALVATYCLARRFVPTGRALFAGALVAIAPGFLAGGPTFMTDIPALAATTACLAIGVAALDRAGRAYWVWLSAALAVGVFGFSIRQFAVAAPVAVLIAAFARFPRKWLPTLALAALLAAACIGVMVWYWNLAGIHQADHFPNPLSSGVMTALRLAASVGIAVLPAAIWALARPGERVARALAVGFAAIVLVYVVAVRFPREVFAGSVLTRWGVSGSSFLAGTRPTLFPPAVWTAMGVAAIAGVTCVVALAAARAFAALRSGSSPASSAWLASPEGVLGAFLVLGGGGLFVVTALGSSAYDRYTWPLVGPLAILLFMRPAPAAAGRFGGVGAVLAVATMCALALVSLALAVNADAYDAARWRAGSSLRRMGVPVQQIDAGFEWFGYHQRGPVTIVAVPGSLTSYQNLYAATRVCALVSSSPMNGARFKPVGVTNYRLFGRFGPTEHLYRYVTCSAA